MRPTYIEDKSFEKINFTESPLERGEYDNCQFTNCDFSNTDLSYPVLQTVNSLAAT